MVGSIYDDGRYLTANPDWHAADAPFKAQWIAQIMTRLGIEPKSVCEIGCGSGEVLLALQHRLPAAKFSGYDISAQASVINRTKTSSGVEFHHADFLATASPPYDVLMAIDVLEHVEDYMGFIRSLKSRASYKVFHIPLDLSVQGLLRGNVLIASRKAVGHLHYFTKETALATLRDCDHEIVGWEYTFGSEMLPQRKLRTRFLNLFRKPLRAINADFAVRLFGGASIMVVTT